MWKIKVIKYTSNFDLASIRDNLKTETKQEKKILPVSQDQLLLFSSGPEAEVP